MNLDDSEKLGSSCKIAIVYILQLSYCYANRRQSVESGHRKMGYDGPHHRNSELTLLLQRLKLELLDQRPPKITAAAAAKALTA